MGRDGVGGEEGEWLKFWCLFHFQMCGALPGYPCWVLGWGHQTSVLTLCKPGPLPKLGFSVRGPDGALWTVTVENHVLRRAGPESAKYQQLCCREQPSALWGWPCEARKL